MIYVFVCVSEKCIGKSSAAQCFSCLVPHENKLGIKFVEDDDLYNEIAHKTNNQLRAMGHTIPVKEEESKSGEEGQIDSSGKDKMTKNKEALAKYYADNAEYDEEDEEGWEEVDPGEYMGNKEMQRIARSLEQKRIIFAKEFLIDNEKEL